MKRAILLSSLALSIIGTLSFSIIANVEGNKHLNMTMDYVVGDKSSLEDLKIKQEISKGQYSKKTLLISKDGVNDEGTKIIFNEPGEQGKDKRLFRGIDHGSYAEDKDYSVIVQAENKKGIFIRYKHNKDYKEFSISNDIIEYNPGSIYDVFVKADDVYFICRNNKSENYLIKINLTSQKMVESIKMNTEIDMYFVSSTKEELGYFIKDDKVYLPALGIDYDIRLFCYDLSNKSLTFKDIKTNLKLKATSMYSVINDEIYFFSYDSTGDLVISSYNMVNDKRETTNVKIPIRDEFRTISFRSFKVKGDFIHLCGDIINNDENMTGFIAGIDKKENSIKYFAKLNDTSRLTYRLMIQ